MNAQEQELLEALRAEFATEALERLQTVTNGLLGLEQGAVPDQAGPILEQIYRNAHNLKGEARAVNYADIETLCQAMETVFAAWKQPGVQREKSAFDALHSALDTIRERLSSPGVPDPERVAAQVQRLSNVISPREAGSREQGAGSAETRLSTLVPLTFPLIDETVRMPIARLEALMLRLEEMLEVKLSTHRRAETLRAAHLMVEQWKHEGDRINSEMGDPGALSGLPPRIEEWMARTRDTIASLETRLSGLSGETDQDDNTVSRLVDSVLDESKKLLMLPFNTLLEMLPKLVRDLAGEQGKEVDVVIRGGEIEIDKRMLQELKDAVIHLVRNCIDHGIENAEERRQRNKPARGTITVEVSLVDAGKVELAVRDDGAGVDVGAVKKVAVKHGILSKHEAMSLGREDAVALIFRSAISTRPVVTSLSGRGLGMAIVKERVEKLGGRISVETTDHEGSVFRLVMPLTLATFRGIFVEVAGQWFIVPSSGVERVGRVRRDQVTTVEDRAVITLAGRMTPFVRLADVLEIPAPDTGTAESLLVFMMLVEASDRRVMFGVDSVLSEDEVLVKSFVKPLSRVRNVAGATILASGKVVPILNVSDLMISATHSGNCRPTPPCVREAVSVRRKNVLLAEDSIISRMLFKSILESAGYAVKTTVDGVEAWGALQTGDFDAVVSDIEMPGMDGFELTSRIRGDSRVAGKPVILVTGREAPEDRARGIEAGANAYIVKSSFDQSDLLEALRKVV